MKKGIIIYRSKYGATEKYAKWLSEIMGFEVIKDKDVSVDKIRDYDIIVFGGGIYAQGISGVSIIKKNIDEIKDKKIIVYCCGASPYSDEFISALKERNFTGKYSDIECYYVRGAWNLDKMNFFDRNLCKMLIKSVSKKDPSKYEEWEKALMSAGDEACDWTDRKYLEPIIKSIESFVSQR